MTTDDYRQKLAAEAELWGAESERMARDVPPDWRAHRRLRHNAVLHGVNIEAFLSQIVPGMAALELGCASGWLTLAMAQRGARAVGLDISEKSLAVARAYYASIHDSVPGTVEYQAADLNALDLPAAAYDVIAVKSTLHHLVRLDHAVEQIHRALKPGGLLWISDTHGDESRAAVLAAGALAFLLPTATPYSEKIRALRQFGLRSPARVQASMQAEGLSPFEGAGREHNWLELVEARFVIERRVNLPAITGYLTAQLKAPDAVALPLLKALRLLDLGLVRLGALRNTSLVIYARKAA